jgi:transcription elongation GreA/GreB family factor
MDREQQIQELALKSSEDSADKSENSFYHELKDKQKLLEYELNEEQRLLNSLPGIPPMTFGLGSNVRIKYLGGEIPEFTATIVPDNEIPFFEFDSDFEAKRADFKTRMNKSGKNPDILGTPLSVHSPLAQAIYGKTNGVYKVIADGEVHRVEAEFC